MALYYVDGEFVAAEQAQIPADDLAVLRGYGVFDFLRTYNGEPFELDAHIRRLFRSAELLMLEMPWTVEDIHAIVDDTLSRNSYPESNIRIVVTGGTSPSRLTPAGNPRLIVMVDPVTVLPTHYFSDGVKLITYNYVRDFPGAKSLNYIPAIIALKQAQAQDAIDALFVDDDGNVLEGTTNNLFIFKDGRLITSPADAILPGITRGVVLELAQGQFEVDVRPMTLAEVYAADEAFLTSSIKEVLPIRQIDDQTIGSGQPGDHTCRLMALFAEKAGIPVRA